MLLLPPLLLFMDQTAAAAALKRHSGMESASPSVAILCSFPVQTPPPPPTPTPATKPTLQKTPPTDVALASARRDAATVNARRLTVRVAIRARWLAGWHGKG